MAAPSKIVVVFDFDKTIIDCDSDNWVVDELGATNLFNSLLPTMPWNALMDRMMRELHAQGKTVEDIRKALTSVPIHPRVVPAIKTAHALGCDLKVLSDANLFFIETVLEHLRIRDCFSDIYTNPGFVDGQGCLRIQPFNSSPHACANPCPPNMCKGGVIEKLLSTLPENIFIYLGDGVGDYCPSLKLREEDHVLPRKDFPVWDLISKTPMLVKAKIHAWTDGQELEQTLLQTISEICASFVDDEDNQLMSADCKLQTVSTSAGYEPLRRTALSPCTISRLRRFI
uniref:Uncharacterized protein n=1 Tax=Kalanchoe fedtschenkoi TaxID=63787 RepID=A0A7N0V2Z0_KALFE